MLVIANNLKKFEFKFKHLQSTQIKSVYGKV